MGTEHNEKETLKIRPFQPIPPQEQPNQTQIAIANIIQAFQGIVPENEIRAAIGNASNPNAVSRALRTRLSPKWWSRI